MSPANPKNPLSKYLVIDASVGRAAGGVDAKAPLSVHCRDFLKAVLDICHRATFSAALLNEWKKHRSMYAGQWLTAMFARKKVHVKTALSEPELEQRLGNATRSNAELEALQKDMHLVLSALAGDRTVISLDNKMRNILGRLAEREGILRDLLWVHPGEMERDVIEWLRAGCPATEVWRLGRKTSI